MVKFGANASKVLAAIFAINDSEQLRVQYLEAYTNFKQGTTKRLHFKFINDSRRKRSRAKIQRFLSKRRVLNTISAFLRNRQRQHMILQLLMV